MDFQLNIHLKYVTSLEYSESMNIAELESYNNIPGITTRMASAGVNIYYCKRLHHINLSLRGRCPMNPTRMKSTPKLVALFAKSKLFYSAKL